MKSEMTHVELSDDKEKIRRLTNVVYSLSKDTGRADDRAARAKNILEGAGKNPGLERLLNEKTLFYNEQEGLPTAVHLESEFEFLKEAPEFQQISQDATVYIESLPLINRGKHTEATLPQEGTIKELARTPYDITRVKLWEVAGKKFVIKRVIHGKVADDLEEYRKTQQATTLSIPTHRPVGYIKDKGNTYLIFEYLENTISALELNQRKIELSRSNFYKPIGSFNFFSDFPPDPIWDKERRHVQELGKVISLLDGIIVNLESVMREHKHQIVFVEYIQELLKNTVIYKGDVERLLSVLKKEFNIDLSSIMLVVAESEKKEWFDNLESQLIKSFGKNFLHKILETKNRLRRQYLELCDSLFKKYTPLLERKFYGASISFPYEDFVKKVKRKADKAGLKMTDLETRNILVKMDKDGERVMPNKNGDAQFYVIDWE